MATARSDTISAPAGTTVVRFGNPVPPADGLTLTGPSGGTVGVASSSFSVGISPSNGLVTGSVVVTPSDGGGGGSFTPSTVTLTQSARTASFTYTPGSSGSKSITLANNGGLTNPAALTYAATAAPAIPSPPSTGFTTTSIQSAAAGSTPFAFGQVFKPGDLPAGQSLTGVQCIVKSTWADGSAKNAVIAGIATLTANTPRPIGMQLGTAPSGAALTTANLKAALTQPVAIGCGAFGTASWSGADWDTPFQTWVSGPLMSSWVYRKPVGTDAHLVAWLEVRLWANGAVEVLPWIENGYLTVAAPTNKNATYTFTMGGTQRFSLAIDLLNHQRTPLLNGTAVSHWLAADPDLTVKHDAVYLQATNLVPTYFASVSPSAASVTALVSSFAPLQRGNWPSVMGNAGSDPSIGLLPDWDVHYLVGTSPKPWKALQFNAYSVGRYGIHFRDQTTNKPADMRSYPTLCLDQNNTHGITAVGSSNANNYTPAATGPVPPFYQNTHTPSMGYMAYLVTGRFYHLETVQFHATINWIKQTDQNRGVNGVLRTTAGACTVRGAAWSLRTLFHAAAISPTGDPLRAAYIASAEANIDYYYDRYVGQTNNPFGFVSPYGDYTQNGDGIFFESTWQQDFFTAAIGFGVLLAMPIASDKQTRLASFFQWKAKSVVGRLGTAASTDFLYRDAAPYTIAVSPSDTPNFTNGSGPWYADWGAIYTATFSAAGNGSPGSKVAGDLRGGNLPDAESYWGNFTPAIAYAVRLGVPGAATGFARVTAEPAWATLLADFNLKPVWSVAAQTTQAAPAPSITGYGTTFGLNETPMVDDGGWQHGALVAGAGNFQNVNTTAGVIHASTFVTDGYDYSVCCRAGWNNNYHEVTGVVYRAAGYSPGVNHEIELVVGVNMAPGSVRLYEWLWNTGGSVQFVRWNGTSGDFTVLAPSGPGIGREPVDGDVMRMVYDARNSASVVITAFLWNASTSAWDQVYTFTDTSAQRITSGNPGASFFALPGATLANFGFKFWSANSGTPAWLNGVAINQWVQLPNSAMSLAPVGMPSTTPATAPSSRMNAWNGFATKNTQVYSVRQGGHNDYYGNEVLRFDLHTANPSWQMIKPSSAFSTSLIIDNTSRYSDGSPAAVHGYAHQRYVRQRDWIMSVGTTAVAYNGGSPTECVAYDVPTNTYLPAGSMPNSAAMAVADNAVWDDPATGNVFHSIGYTVHRWNQSSNTWSFNVASVASFYGISSVACTDTLRRRAILLAGDPAARVPTVYDMKTNGVTTVTPTGDLSIVNRAGGFGMTFCPVLDRFYAMTGGANGAGLYEMHPTTWAISAKTTSGASGMAAAAATGIYTRFTYIPSLGGIVYFPQYTSNAWFLRLH